MEPNQMPPQPTKPSSNPMMKVALVALLALAAVFGYLWMSEKNVNIDKETEIQAKAEEIAAAKIKIDSISRQLDMKIQEITALGGQVEELQAAKAELERDKTSLRKNAVSAKDLQGKLGNYDALLAAKDKEIERLRGENKQLASQNQNLNSQNQNLSTENTGLKSDVDVKTKTIDEVSGKNKVLSEKVAIAAALKANGLEVNAIADNGKERDGGKYRASKVTKLKIIFTLANNPLTEQENKTLYLRIIGPDGTTLSDAATGSGTMDFLGKETTYTASTTAMYTNNNQTVSILWGKGNTDWKEGNYTAELYAEGFKIGSGGFTIK